MHPRNQEFTIPESAPGPSPWYFGPKVPSIPGHRWKREDASAADCAGKVFLVDAAGTRLVLDMYHFVLPLGGSQILTWQRNDLVEGRTAPVRFVALDLSVLAPLGKDRQRLAREMAKGKKREFFEGPALAEFELETLACSRDLPFSFPPAVSALVELLFFCRSSDTEGDGDAALMVVRPREGFYRLYPQRWFNMGERDYDWEWVTRAARDPATGRIHGEGIRVADFVLDESMENLAQ